MTETFFSGRAFKAATLKQWG